MRRFRWPTAAASPGRYHGASTRCPGHRVSGALDALQTATWGAGGCDPLGGPRLPAAQLVEIANVTLPTGDRLQINRRERCFEGCSHVPA